MDEDLQKGTIKVYVVYMTCAIHLKPSEVKIAKQSEIKKLSYRLRVYNHNK